MAGGLQHPFDTQTQPCTHVHKHSHAHMYTNTAMHTCTQTQPCTANAARHNPQPASPPPEVRSPHGAVKSSIQHKRRTWPPVTPSHAKSPTPSQPAHLLRSARSMVCSRSTSACPGSSTHVTHGGAKSRRARCGQQAAAGGLSAQAVCTGAVGQWVQWGNRCSGAMGAVGQWVQWGNGCSGAMGAVGQWVHLTAGAAGRCRAEALRRCLRCHCQQRQFRPAGWLQTRWPSGCLAAASMRGHPSTLRDYGCAAQLARQPWYCTAASPAATQRLRLPCLFTHQKHTVTDLNAWERPAPAGV